MADSNENATKKRGMESTNEEENEADDVTIKKRKELDASSSLHNYQDDSDFDEAFKNLLKPIETISKQNHCEPLKYDLLKELDSYLFHLKDSSDLGGSMVFVEAALMMQNVILIYQKRVDQVIDNMMNLAGKFRAYNKNKDDKENEKEGNANAESVGKKHKEKKVKYYPSFEPIVLKFNHGSCFNNFDCRRINMSKKPTIPRIVLNANIKVENKYSKLLPYICIGNGENIGKKYEFLLNYPLNRDLAVNAEFDCPTNKNKESATTLIYRKSTDPLPMNLMEIDDDVGVSDDICPSPNTPDPVIFDQTINNEVCVANAKLPNPTNILNVSQIPSEVEEKMWLEVDHNITKDKDNILEKPFGNAKRSSKKEDNATIWLPAYTVGELRSQLILLKMGLPVDSNFRQIVRLIQSVQKSEASKMRIKQIIEADKEKFDYHDEEMENKLKSGDEPGFRGFSSPIPSDCFDDNVVLDIMDEQEEVAKGNFLSYHDIHKDMEIREQEQLDIINEQALMLTRVHQWHDNLRPILEEEEKRTEFDIHEYGTRLLNCFESIGEQKTFKELIGGLPQEEVSRYFLSILMMTNTYNLKLSKSSDGEMIIELLKKERHHEELQVNIGNQVNQ